MKESVKTAVRQLLATYLENNNCRKTPERFAVLDAVYSFGGHFSIPELNERLEKENFYVSRATLYNTLNLFVRLHLVVCHRLGMGTVYEACYANSSHSHQICTMCGKVVEVKSPAIAHAVEETRLRRFRRDGFALYIYGMCSTCQAKLTREKNKKFRNSENEKMRE